MLRKGCQDDKVVLMNNFYATRDRMPEYYWKFVELFFKKPITEQTVAIAISFCYASYFIWKEGEGKTY